MRLIVNGETCEIQASPDLSLLTWLRREKGLISLKDGCSQGVCGSCSVLINDKAQRSCLIKINQLPDNSVIETLEGFSEKEMESFTRAFVEKGGVQCGYCTPGMLVSAKALLRKNPEPSRDEIAKGIRNNLCRCTGYHKIISSIESASNLLRNEKEVGHGANDEKGLSQPEHCGVGARVKKYEAECLIQGKKAYVADLRVQGMLYGALKFTDHPRARILHVDMAEARAYPGVHGVLLAEDVPGSRCTGLIHRDWPLMIAEGELTHYIGDVIAEVVADTPEIARAAARLIEVQYEVLPPVSHFEQAVAEDAPRVHPEHSNVLCRSSVQRGDAENQLGNSELVVSGVYETQCVEHAFLEVESCLAVPGQREDETIHIYSQGQGVYEDQRQIAMLLNLPEKSVTVELVPNGGGFGGKEDLTVQGHAALACTLLNCPVQFTLTREESMRMHPKKHPMRLHYRLGCDLKGKLTALQARIETDSGAYASVGMKVIERAVGHATGAYFVPHVSVEGVAVYTNNIPNGAMRGFGANQATFAMETALEELCALGRDRAEKEGLNSAPFDPFEFRLNNVLRPGDSNATGQVIGADAGAEACLRALAPYYKVALKQGKVAGLACGIKNTGVGNGMPDECRVKLEILAGGRIRVHHGWTEMGQGVFTMCQQVVCEELSLEIGNIEVMVDTSYRTPAGMTTSSRATTLVGNALLDACASLKNELKQTTMDRLTGRFFEGYWVCDWTAKPRPGQHAPTTHFSYSYAAQCAVLDEKGKIERVVAAHDAGRVMNPTLFEGQIEGAIHMGLGYAVREEFIQKDCMPVTTKLGKCGILRSTEMPPVDVIPVEVPDLHGPYGAKGVGEIGLVPTAGAVGNALYHFDGRFRRRLPFKERILKR